MRFRHDFEVVQENDGTWVAREEFPTGASRVLSHKESAWQAYAAAVRRLFWEGVRPS